ncbi:MAG: cytochrome C [Betaproteobacteria bacterium]|nr:cytochrome C [Betaproteobacteria bacterium]
MKRLVFALFLASTASFAEDGRELVPMPPAAQEALQQEMIENLLALNEVLGLIGNSKFPEAGEVAEKKLGVSAMGKHRGKPVDARPGAHMPEVMHNIGVQGHVAASEFAVAAKASEYPRAMSLLPNLTAACVGCHSAYRIR